MTREAAAALCSNKLSTKDRLKLTGTELLAVVEEDEGVGSNTLGLEDAGIPSRTVSRNDDVQAEVKTHCCLAQRAV